MKTLYKFIIIVLAFGTVALAVSGGKESVDERISTVVWYEVDPSWPDKPADFTWGNKKDTKSQKAYELPQQSVPGVAVDKQDRVWILTRTEPPVQVYDKSGKFIRAWGEKMFKATHHIKIDRDGNIWASDASRHVIRKFTPEGKLLLTLGTLDEAGKDKKHFDRPTDMAITPKGDIFVSDGYGNSRIVHFDSKGRFVKTWGSKGIKTGQFNLPHAIVVDSKGRLYVADRANARIQVFKQNGKFVADWADIIVPWGIWITDKDEIWVCGSSPMQWRDGDERLGCPPKDQLVMKFNTKGKLLQLWTIPKGADGQEKPGELNWVHGIALDSKGNIYLGDIKGGRVQKFVRRTDARARD